VNWSWLTKQDSPVYEGGQCCGSRNKEFLDEKDETRPLGGEGRSGNWGRNDCFALFASLLKRDAAWIFFLFFFSVTRGDAWTV
jgi:hypothetical protein